ncbi:MAG: DUF2236 domain-containing protein [Saprospiraceae bacterium]|nr:DUF2236 domain-containing protein [Saprospiraceae bacterium]
MDPNYCPPDHFFISDDVPSLTPAEFDLYRHKKDPVADRIAAFIYQFSKDWAAHHIKKAAEKEQKKKKREKRYKEAHDDLKHAEKAFHFFSHMEKAIANPHPPGEEHDFRYKWDEDTLEVARLNNNNMEAIKELDAYFDDRDVQTDDPFSFLFDDAVQRTIERGAKIFEAYGTNVIGILAVRSLLKQYAAFNASNVLVSTKFLTRFPHRRIFETMQFLIDIVTPGSLKKDGKGIIAIKKLRLVHALVRHRITTNDKNINQKFTSWNAKVWGEPINQQDMIFAVHTFSIEIIRGLQKSGYFLDLTEKERLKAMNADGSEEELERDALTTNENRTIKEDYYLTWHYIGKALGVMDEINPKTYEDGWKLQQYIYHTQFRLGDFEEEEARHPNLTSPVLAEPLINFIKEIIPFTNSREDALAVVAFYNDESDYDPIFRDILGLDIKGLANHEFYDFVAGALNGFDRFLEVFYHVKPRFGLAKPTVVRKIGSLNRALFKRLRKMSKSWKGGSFTLRDGLDTEAGFVEQVKRGGRSAGTLLSYFFTFVVVPVLFLFLGPLSQLIKRKIAKRGHRNPRLTFNRDAADYGRNAALFLSRHDPAIKNNRLYVGKHLTDAGENYDPKTEKTAFH